MKKISFDIVFKIIVLLLLSIILIICFNNSKSTHYQRQEPTGIGRYKEIKVAGEVLILDTKTGKTKYPN